MHKEEHHDLSSTKNGQSNQGEWNEGERGGKSTGENRNALKFLMGLKVKGQLKELGMNGSILKWILKNQDCRVWTGLIWLRIWKSNRTLVNTVMISGLHNFWRISWLGEKLLTSQEWLSFRQNDIIFSRNYYSPINAKSILITCHIQKPIPFKMLPFPINVQTYIHETNYSQNAIFRSSPTMPLTSNWISLTLIVLMWRIGWAHNNARK